VRTGLSFLRFAVYRRIAARVALVASIVVLGSRAMEEARHALCRLAVVSG
jgi:hypothetical protein